MSKKITQEEFDEEVRSLLEDFCLNEEEAIEDAIREFEMKVRLGPHILYISYLSVKNFLSFSLTVTHDSFASTPM